MNAYRADVDPFDALGDATRRAIVESLRDGERTVGDLATGLPVSRPAVSQHLGVLKAAGLVLERPEGTRRYYRLDPIGLIRLLNRLDAMWGGEAAPSEVMPAPPEPISAPAPAPKPARKLSAQAVREAPDKEERGGKSRKKRKKKGGRK